MRCKSHPPPPPPPPPPAYTYAVKFVLSTAKHKREGVVPADYSTAINIHNPTDRDIVIYKKAVLAQSPWAIPVPPSPFREAKLLPDGALEIAGPDICLLLGLSFPPLTFIKGFVVIQSPVCLDVVAVYTASSKTGLSIDVEHIPPSYFVTPPVPVVTPPPEKPPPEKPPVHKPTGFTVTPREATNPVGTTHTIYCFRSL